jgi:hypothetical protein
MGWLGLHPPRYAFCFLSRLSRHSYLAPHQDKEQDDEFEDVDEDVE